MFSMERAWQDMLGMLRTHREAIIPIAGIFAFLPSLAYNIFVPPPEFTGGGADAAAAIAAFFAAWWPALLALVLLSILGGLAILVLALADRPIVVRNALASAVQLWPSAIAFWVLCVLAGFILTLIAAFVLSIVALAIFGRSPVGALLTLLAILPALYLMGRTVHGNALIVAEGERNPWRVFTASLAMSKGRGWMIAGMFVLIFVVYLVVLLAVTAVIGIAISLIAPSAAPFVQGIVAATFAAIMSVVTFLLSGAVYRQLGV